MKTYRLTLEFQGEPDQIPGIERQLRALLPRAADLVGVQLDHFRVDLVPEEPEVT